MKLVTSFHFDSFCYLSLKNSQITRVDQRLFPKCCQTLQKSKFNAFCKCICKLNVKTKVYMFSKSVVVVKIHVWSEVENKQLISFFSVRSLDKTSFLAIQTIKSTKQRFIALKVHSRSKVWV